MLQSRLASYSAQRARLMNKLQPHWQSAASPSAASGAQPSASMSAGSNDTAQQPPLPGSGSKGTASADGAPGSAGELELSPLQLEQQFALLEEIEGTQRQEMAALTLFVLALLSVFRQEQYAAVSGPPFSNVLSLKGAR